MPEILDIFIIVSTCILFTLVIPYYISFWVHIEITTNNAVLNSFKLEKINFKQFKQLFDQYIWSQQKQFPISFFYYKTDNPMDYLENYEKFKIHAQIIVINGISYRLKWYSYIFFKIWARKPYKPNKNLLMAYL